MDMIDNSIEHFFLMIFNISKVELVIGLTDRVVRTYQWINTKLVGLNKWEFANQIGTVAINDMANRTPSLLVAHPGGTFIRLKCKPLENFEEYGKEEQRYILKSCTANQV